MTGLFDPYQQWLGIRPEEQPTNLYRLLGLRLFESDPQVIHAAVERRAAYVRARAAGAQANYAKQILGELNSARQILCDPAQKAHYDRNLGGAAAPAMPAVAPAFARPAPMPPRPTVARPATAQPGIMQPVIAIQPAAPPAWQCEPEAPVSFGINTSPSASYRTPSRTSSGAVGIFAGLAVAAAAGIGGYLFAQSRTPATVPVAKTTTDSTSETKTTPETKTTATKGTPEAGKTTPETKGKEPVKTTVTKTVPKGTTTPVKPPVVTDPNPVVVSQPPVQPPTEVVKNPPVRDPGEFDDPEIIRRPRSFGGRFDLSSLVAASQSSDPESTIKPIDPEMFPILKKKLPVPGLLEQSKALSAIRAAHRADYQQATLPAGKVSLARMFLTEAARSIDDSTSRFVYLAEARDLAIDGSSPGLSMVMVDSMARMYAINVIDMKYSALTRGATSAKTNVAQRSISTNALAMIETAIVDNDFDSANKLLELGLSSARTAKDGKLVKLASTLRTELKSIGDQFKLAEAARAKLAGTPEDAESHATLGRYLLRAGDWDEALKHLAKGSDMKLQALAARDLALPAMANARRELGDAWWDLGEGAEEGIKSQYRQRAKHWYEQSLAGLDGLNKFQVEFRLKQLADAGNTAAGEGASPTIEPSSEPLPPLAKKLVGKYDLLAVEKKTQQKKAAVWEFLATRQAVEDGKIVATWDLDDTTRMKVTFVDSDRGVLYLRFNVAKTQLTGGTTLSTGEMWRWELTRIVPGSGMGGDEGRPLEPNAPLVPGGFGPGGFGPNGPGGPGAALPPGAPIPLPIDD